MMKKISIILFLFCFNLSVFAYSPSKDLELKLNTLSKTIESLIKSKPESINSLKTKLEKLSIKFSNNEKNSYIINFLSGEIVKSEKLLKAYNDIKTNNPNLKLDLKSFENTGDIYFKDKNYIFFLDGLLTGVDIKSFEIIYSVYSRDNKHVFYGNTVITGADPKTFEIISGNTAGYIKDKDHVFWDNKIMIGADPKTFEIIDFGYSRDADSVFYKNNIIDGSDPKTFTITYGNDAYGIDKNHVYEDGEIIKGADPKTFDGNKYEGRKEIKQEFGL